jgi:hypothetical protein
VFCTLYTFEQFLASSLGRPSGLNDMDVQVMPPREGLLGGGQDGDDELLSFSVQLQKILSKARLVPSVAGASGPGYDLERHRESARAILDSLRDWKVDVAKRQGLDIPSIIEAGDPFPSSPGLSMRFDELKLMLGWQNRTRLRAALLMHLQYHNIAILVTRPFLYRSVASGRRNIASPIATTQPQGLMDFPDICVAHACQLSRIVLLLDCFNLVNGISGLDVFYAYCAAMVLILRSLRQRDTANEDAYEKESALLLTIRDLTTKLREAVTRSEKSGTMKRFARVMANFEESVYNERSRKPAPATADARAPTDGSVIYPQLQAASLPSHQAVGVGGQFPGMSSQPDTWTAEGLVTFEGVPDFNSWVGPFLGAGTDASMMDWADIETMLGTYGQPP